jgi:hypothetical protein
MKALPLLLLMIISCQSPDNHQARPVQLDDQDSLALVLSGAARRKDSIIELQNANYELASKLVQMHIEKNDYLIRIDSLMSALVASKQAQLDQVIAYERIVYKLKNNHPTQ